MKAEWMANVGGQEYGPFTWDQMLQMAAEGRVAPDLPVRKASDSQWSDASAVPGLLGGIAAPAPTAAGPAAAKVVSAPAKAATQAVPKGATIKKARPLKGPPVGRPVPPVVTAPQTVPAGVPVGTPVTPPPIQPPAPAPAFSLDVSGSGSFKKPGGKRPAGQSALDDDVPLKKKRSPLVLVGVLGGATALVGAIAGVVIFIMLNRGSGETKVAATNASHVTGGTLQAGEANPAGAEGESDGEVKRMPTAKSAKAAKADARSTDAAAQLAAVKSIGKWMNVATSTSMVIGNAKFSVHRVWLATDASGQRVSAAEEPKSPAAEGPLAEAKAAQAKDADSAPAAPSAKTAQPKYVFLEVTIGNKAGSPLKYKGWNIAKTAPFMLDDQDRILKLVPNAETPGVARLTKADVPGGGTVDDILAFEAPSEPFEKLRVVLPQNVFYDRTRNPYIGIEITTDVLDSSGGPPAPSAAIAGGDENPNNPLVTSRKLPPDPAIPEGVIPAEPAKDAKAAAKKEEAPAKKPSLFDEVNKFEEDLKKKMEEEKGKEPSAPAKTEPKVDAAKEPEKKTEPAKKTEPSKKTLPAKKPVPAKKTPPKKPEPAEPD